MFVVPLSATDQHENSWLHNHVSAANYTLRVIAAAAVADGSISGSSSSSSGLHRPSVSDDPTGRVVEVDSKGSCSVVRSFVRWSVGWFRPPARPSVR